jgi:dihydropteroate synthase
MTNSCQQSEQTPGSWQTARFTLKRPVYQDTGRLRPWLMGIVNLTPDSFSDGGRYNQTKTAIQYAQQLLKDEADILDIGAESTRPGAEAVNLETEWQRLSPVLTELVRWNVPLSLDSMKPEIMQRALDLGVDILNDVGGFQLPQTQSVLAKSQAGAVVMHMQGQPRTMQRNPQYLNCVSDVLHFLTNQVNTLTSLNVLPNRIMVDPGFGFGKNLGHNLDLLRATAQFAALGAGVLVGVSRKSMIGQITGQVEPSLRISGSVQAATMATGLGATVLRVHDVQATRDALRVQNAVLG